MHFKTQFLFALILTGVLSMTSCSSDSNDSIVSGPDDDNAELVNGRYVIATNDGENSYLVTTDDIKNGSLSVQNSKSTQVFGTPEWFFSKDMGVYAFIRIDHDAGSTKSFTLTPTGEIAEGNEFDVNMSIEIKGQVGDDFYIAHSSRNFEDPTGLFYKVIPKEDQIQGPFKIDTKELAGNGEYAFMTDITDYDDMILIGYKTIKAGSDGGDDLFASDHFNHTFVGVYNNDLELVRIIEDSTRTGVVAGQLRGHSNTGIEPVDDGDIYVFSSAMDAEDTPSGILKINKGDLTQFDSDYFFDISKASGGYKLFRTYYMGDYDFVLQMFDEPNTSSSSPDITRKKFAIINVKDQSFKWVEGIPDGILAIGEPYIDKTQKQLIVLIETSGYPHLYSIDAPTGEVTEGLEIKAEGVDAIGKLSVQE